MLTLDAELQGKTMQVIKIQMNSHNHKQDVATATATNIASHISSARLKDGYVADFLYKPQECQKSSFANAMFEHVRKCAPAIDAEAVKQTIQVLMLHGLPISRFDASYLPKENISTIDEQFQHVISQAQVPNSDNQSNVNLGFEDHHTTRTASGSNHRVPLSEMNENVPLSERNDNIGEQFNVPEPLPENLNFGDVPDPCQARPSNHAYVGQHNAVDPRPNIPTFEEDLEMSKADWDMVGNNLPAKAKQLFTPRAAPQSLSNVAPQFSNCHSCTINLTVAPSMAHWPNVQPHPPPQ